MLWLWLIGDLPEDVVFIIYGLKENLEDGRS